MDDADLDVMGIHLVLAVAWLVTLAWLTRVSWSARRDPRRQLGLAWLTTALVAASGLYIALTNAAFPGLHIDDGSATPGQAYRLMLLGEQLFLAQAVLGMAVVTWESGGGPQARLGQALTATAGLVAAVLASLTGSLTALLSMTS